MPGRLDGYRIVVTGASRGIGRALAQAFAAEGARLALTATRRTHLSSTLSSCAQAGADAVGVELDLADHGRTRRAASEIVAHLGRVEALVNNAGLLGVRTSLEDYPIDVWERVMRVGVDGTLLLTQRILPAMSRGSVVLNVTSGAAGRPGWGAYGVSRAALNAMTAMLRQELEPRGIRAVAVNPGPARTEMRAAAYPREDPATVPHPSALVEPFVRIASGWDPGPGVLEVAHWSP